MEIFFIIFWIICCVIAGVISQNNDQSFLKGFLIGVLFGPIGIMFVQFSKPKDTAACPFCGAEIHRQTPICRNCKQPLPDNFAKEHSRPKVNPVVWEVILVLIILCLVFAIIGLLFLNQSV